MTTTPNMPGKELFKKYLRKIGSGEHTGKSLNRDESAEALKLILKSEATPAQIGAFMIAHRIRRPEPKELAGMLDTYQTLGPNLYSKPNQKRPICFGMPFDGRTRTSPIYPLTSLILISANQPVILQGGQRMPIKYGISTIELFEALGLNLKGLKINELQLGLDNFGFALVHQPEHFPLAERLITYREEIGKRPPIASMELLWTAHQGEHLIISGFVHPPTEERAWKTLALFGENNFITVKGLEGGVDLPISRACITATIHNEQTERTILYPKEHNCHGQEIEWTDLDSWKDIAVEALNNKGILKKSLYWNAGVYLWFAGVSQSIEDGIKEAESILSSGLAKETLENLITWRKLIS